MPAALPLRHLRHARLRRPIPTSARAWWRVPTLADLRGVTATFGLSIADSDRAIFRPAGPSTVGDRRLLQGQRPRIRRGRGAMHLVACRLIAAW